MSCGGCVADAARCRTRCGSWARPTGSGCGRPPRQRRAALSRRRRRSGCDCIRADRRQTHYRIRCGVARRDSARNTGTRYKSSVGRPGPAALQSHAATRHLRSGPGPPGRRRPVGDRDRHMSRSTAPRSWITSGRDTAADSASLNPVASASIRVIALPACCATSSPRTSTRRFFDHSVIACICQVRLPLDYQVVEKPDYP